MYESEKKSGYDREAEYFKQQEMIAKAKLREKMNKAGQALARQQAAGKDVGANADDLMATLEANGFARETARVLDLLPIIHVAWADGTIQPAERDAVYKLLELRGIARGREPWSVVDVWLDKQPSGEFLDNVLKLIRQIYKGRGESPTDVVDMAVRIAESSGGFLGFGTKISEAERDIIERIAERLGPAAEEELKREMH